jgi:hypothetical protein
MPAKKIVDLAKPAFTAAEVDDVTENDSPRWRAIKILCGHDDLLTGTHSNCSSSRSASALYV